MTTRIKTHLDYSSAVEIKKLIQKSIERKR